MLLAQGVCRFASSGVAGVVGKQASRAVAAMGRIHIQESHPLHAAGRRD